MKKFVRDLPFLFFVSMYLKWGEKVSDLIYLRETGIPTTLAGTVMSLQGGI